MKNFNYPKELVSIFMIVMFVSHSTFAGDKRTKNLVEAVNSHQKAVHIMDDWMRDPYITIGPDGYYYLTATQQVNETNSQGAPVWRSLDLVQWDHIGFPYQLKEASNYEEYLQNIKKRNDERGDDQPLRLWAPEMHFINGNWVYVHTSNAGLGNLAIAQNQMEGPFKDWGTNFQRHHDPTLFVDDDGAIYLGERCAAIGRLKKDLSGYEEEPVNIGPSNRKLGHEGIYIVKIEGKYVLFGTAWSTDIMRHGTYNLYYCTSDNIWGPYGERKFAGRFLGHGTPFKDKQGRWWCTAFYNANKPVLKAGEVYSKDVSDTAYTLNKQGLTLVPLEIKLVNGDVVVKAKDPLYEKPGSEEVQQFE